MELYFCDLCQAAVPEADIETGRASLAGERVVCEVCNGAMAATSALQSSSPAPTSSPGESASTAPGREQRPARRGPSLAGSVAAALSVAAISLTLVAVVALLVRINSVERELREEQSRSREKLQAIETQQLGTRRFMISEAGRVADEVLSSELERLERLEQQLVEVRTALLDEAPREDGAQEERSQLGAGPLITAGDTMARVGELEQQILFLQSRVYDLVDGGGSAPIDVPRATETTSETELSALLKDSDPLKRLEGLFRVESARNSGEAAVVVLLLDDSDAHNRTQAARTL